MQRRRRITRLIVRGVATAAVGGFLGFLVPTVAGDLFPSEQAQVERAPVPESMIARQFIDAFTTDNQEALSVMGFSNEVKLRASQLRTDFARVDTAVHLGSYFTGGGTLHAYAAHAVRHDGSDAMLGWRVITTGNGFGIIWPPDESVTE